MLSIKRILIGLASLFIFTTPAHASDARQIECIARNAVYEAGNQGERGMIAVSNVVMNRTRDDRFPSTPCGVINQKKRGVCQFSWVCQRKLPRMNLNMFHQAREVAERVYYARARDVTSGALFYHADYVRPRWAYVFKRTTTIGDHIFYKG